MAWHSGLARAFWIGSWAVSCAVVGACGKTSGSSKSQPTSEAGGGHGGRLQAPGNGSQGNVAGLPATSGAAAGGASSQGGSTSTQSAAGDGGEGGATPCIDGALCHCGDASGTLRCAEAGGVGECSCPALETCEVKRAKCFEPCGGDPRGAWVLVQTCLEGSSTGERCPAGIMSGTAPPGDFRIRIDDDHMVQAIGQERLNVQARVPLSCLGIESVNRCKDAEFYVSPFLLGISRPIRCKATDCGDCQCSGAISAFDDAALDGINEPSPPDSDSLWFGRIQVPYCVDGDSLWVGGTLADGTSKASYKFRRRSCTGNPTPCEQRDPSNCGEVDEGCWPGHCVATAALAEECDGQSEQGCAQNAGCTWQATQHCWGSTAEACEFENCDRTPGCSWGEPQARCRGELTTCYEQGAAGCTMPGCTPRTCVYGDGGNVDIDCEVLSANACAKAPGCELIGGRCSGTTDCWGQTDGGVCDSLGCSPQATALCTGEPTQKCSDFSADDCVGHGRCHLEW